MAVKLIHDVQSSSANGSSIDTILYLTQSLERKLENSNFDRGFFWLARTYLLFLKSSPAAISSPNTKSFPALYPLCLIASYISLHASSSFFKSGANPPSSPTAVLYPFLLISLLNYEIPLMTFLEHRLNLKHFEE